MDNYMLIGIFITLLAYLLANKIQEKFKSPLLNPILISIILLVLALKFLNISYEDYNKGGVFISFFVGPATIALVLPLYKNFTLFKDNMIVILIGCFIASVTSIVGVLILGSLLNINIEIILSMIPKSTTSSLAIDISKDIGGIESLTLVFVIVTGIIGNILSPKIIEKFHIKNNIAKGISIGSSSHIVGTAKAIELGEEIGAMSSIAISITGFITLLIAPPLIKILI